MKITIPIRRKEISSANILEIEAGINGPRGGDSGHGGRTYLKLSNNGATSWKVKVTDAWGTEQETEEPRYIEIVLGGDTELDTFIQGLKFAVETLEQMSKRTKEYVKEIDW